MLGLGVLGDKDILIRDNNTLMPPLALQHNVASLTLLLLLITNPLPAHESRLLGKARTTHNPADD